MRPCHRRANLVNVCVGVFVLGHGAVQKQQRTRVRVVLPHGASAEHGFAARRRRRLLDPHAHWLCRNLKIPRGGFYLRAAKILYPFALATDQGKWRVRGCKTKVKSHLIAAKQALHEKIVVFVDNRNHIESRPCTPLVHGHLPRLKFATNPSIAFGEPASGFSGPRLVVHSRIRKTKHAVCLFAE